MMQRTVFKTLIDDSFPRLLSAIDAKLVGHIYGEETYDMLYKTLPWHFNSLRN